MSTMELVALKTNVKRWSDLTDDDEGDLSYLLPPRRVIGPDKNGIKIVIDYRINERGEMVKVTTRTRVRTIKLTKGAAQRRSWAKFGDAASEDVGSRLTVVSTENVLLERPKAQGSDQAMETKISGGDVGNKGGALMVCRACGRKGDHWTARCPYKDLLQDRDSAVNRPPSADGNASSSSTIKKSSTYIPPSKRGGSDMKGRSYEKGKNYENSVKVSNLSENVHESDIRELFGAFGPVTRVFLSTDRQTGLCRGFGFVDFVNYEDAQRAIDKLHRYGYDNLILEVKWAR